MKKLIFISAISLFAMGCGSATGPAGNANTATPIAVATPTPHTGPTATPVVYAPDAAVDSPETEPKPKVERLIDLKGTNGLYAKDLKFWESKEITGRLEKLLGTDYAAMKKNWNTESPVTVVENVAMLSGCQQSNCGANNYIVFADTATDNINVIHLKDGKSKKYSEKGEIVLPQDFTDLLVKMGANTK